MARFQASRTQPPPSGVLENDPRGPDVEHLLIDGGVNMADFRLPVVG